MRFPAVAKRLLPEFSPDANDALADVSLARDWRAHDFPPAPRARAASHEPGREALGVEQMRAPRHAREVRLPRGEVAQAHRALTGASGGAVEREGGARERSQKSVDSENYQKNLTIAGGERTRKGRKPPKPKGL